MQGQAKLSSFFSPKRSTSSEDEVSEAKRRKPSDEAPCERTGLALTPEQKARVEEKRKNAQRLLVQKKTPPGMGETWTRALADEFAKEYFVKLSRFVEVERSKTTIYPPDDSVFSWTRYCKIGEVKVVILGQDPYHQPKQAHGLCFSVPYGVQAPPSLVNIYKELETDIESFKAPKHGNLEKWAKQGVLLLNACLTVQASKPNSHKDKGWETFTDAVIDVLNKKYTGIVFLLWGAYAQKKGAKIDKKKHHVLKAAHPSPLAAYKGFFGCKHFSKANAYLESRGETPINWNCLSD
ncbi:uracil-DNA glycosylase-like [Oscarella lobularis]|uniref:uracil-DNA glycosylase-like n=1 Tax=Oscarella lobularis TaxID=121494 RepID=UPI00331318BE